MQEQQQQHIRQQYALYPVRRSPTFRSGDTMIMDSHHLSPPMSRGGSSSNRSISSSTYMAANNTPSGSSSRVPSDSSTAVGHADDGNDNNNNLNNEKIEESYPDTSRLDDVLINSGLDPRHSPPSSPPLQLAATIHHYTPLTPEQRKLAFMHRQSRDRRSAIPIFYFLAASLGKLILGFGVSLAIKGHYAAKKLDFGLGIGLAAAGFIAVVAAALGFGAAVSMVNKRWGIIFKCFSIGGGILICIGYALKQYFVSEEDPLFSIRLAFIPLALGTACMGISLPNFTAYTELYRGRVPGLPIHRRPLIALLCLSPSMGILFGGWISTEVSHWPIAFHSAVLTFAVALGYAGVAIFWSNNLRHAAELYELRLCREEEERNSTVTVVNTQQEHLASSTTATDAEKRAGAIPAGAAALRRHPQEDV